MTTQQYRLMIAVANVTLVGCIGLLAWRTYTGSAPDPAELPPDGFNIEHYAAQDDGKKTNTLEAHKASWQQLDGSRFANMRPRAPVTKPPPKITRPTVQDLSRTYEIDYVAYNKANPKTSSVILRHRSRNTHKTLSIGGLFDGYKVLDIQISGDRETRVAEVILEYRNKRHTLKLKERKLRR